MTAESPVAHDGTDSVQNEDFAKKRPYSIDLSLELERQLDNESLPPTPAAPIRPQSIDQTVLTSLVVQLRQTLAEVTSERDRLREQLTQAQSDKRGAEEALHQFTTKCAQMEDELEAGKVKMRDDEYAISMLRTKVEESRRGLMRLQAESRRSGQSNMTIDTARGGFSTPSTSKRQSFTPLTGTRINAHKRISSVSDSAFLASLSTIDTPGSPDSQIVSLPDLALSTSSRPPPVSSRRFSGVFGLGSPPNSLDLRHQDPLIEEMEALRREMKSIKVELEETRHELSEANEAKEASETCAKALRDFIAQTQGAATYAELDRLPQQTNMKKDPGPKKSISGWSAFKMWKVDTSVAAAPTSTGAVNSPSSVSQATPTAAAPFATKVGSFFSSRASISSTTSPPASTSTPSCASDTSSTGESTSEPISPMNEAPPANLLVRNSSASVSIEFASSQSGKMVPDPLLLKTATVS